MANIKSQIKRNRQNERRRLANKTVRSEVKTRMKNAVVAAESGDREAALEALRVAQQKLDKAAAKGVMKKETVSRRKSRLSKQVSSILG
ncbi:MAG: 30S ribosomal protein S20 [Acidimicrobiia bacterium]|nr:30S ribosomal protein S20 [Acidimicrobiia bacterium]